MMRRYILSCYKWSEVLYTRPLFFLSSDTVRVPQPQVSITTADWVILQPKEAEVVLGKRFTVTCSVHRSFGTGFFSLTSPAGTYSRPEVNQSAVFEFPPAQTEHQGKYSCVHEIIQSSKNATSMKTSFIIQVRGGCPSSKPRFFFQLDSLAAAFTWSCSEFCCNCCCLLSSALVDNGFYSGVGERGAPPAGLVDYLSVA